MHLRSGEGDAGMAAAFGWPERHGARLRPRPERRDGGEMRAHGAADQAEQRASGSLGVRIIAAVAIVTATPKPGS